MKFIDEATIYVKAGDGGKGCVSFRREKFVPRGGPDGGSGGKGGDVIIAAGKSHGTLLDLKYRPRHEAKRGGQGQGGNRTGESAPDVLISVPAGTVVIDAESGSVLADLTKQGDRFLAAAGGLGGKGNAWFVSSTHQAPRFAQEGLKGEARTLRLELKLLADVGIVGFPNVGKSSFIARVSAAKPKIADYPFTTLTPNLGVVKYASLESFVIADIPGLIKGAHRGVGRGIQFLRHIERTGVLLHILDISGEDSPDPWERYLALNEELAHYDRKLLEKPQIVAINKTDLPETRERLARTKEIFRGEGIEPLAFSAATGEGVREVVARLAATLSKSGQ